MTTTDFQNNSCYSDFTVRHGPNGGLRRLRVQNENDTAASSAAVEAYVEGTTAADPYFRSVVGAAHSYAAGIDTSAARDWKLTYDASANATPSSALQIIDADLQGRLLYPNQPMMKAYLAGDVLNATGDNVAARVVFDTVLYDRGACYNVGTGIYTVPKAGVYALTAMVTIRDLTLLYTTGGMHINVAGVPVIMPQSNPWANAQVSIAVTKNYYAVSTYAACTAGQAIDVFINVGNTGAGGKFIGVFGGIDQTIFTVNLIG